MRPTTTEIPIQCRSDLGARWRRVAVQQRLRADHDAGMRRFQATGTRFNVRVISPELTELTVTNGTVKVMDAPPRLPETPAQRRATLLYGETTVQALETAQVERGFQSVSQIDETEAETRLAWQRGLIIFEDEALQDALNEIDACLLRLGLVVEAEWS